MSVAEVVNEISSSRNDVDSIKQVWYSLYLLLNEWMNERTNEEGQEYRISTVAKLNKIYRNQC